MDRRIQLVVKRLMTLILLIVLLSCSSKKCDILRLSYQEEWKEEIDTIICSPDIKFLYLMKTKQGKRIRIYKLQWVVKNYQHGDSIYKKRNSPFAYVYRNGEFVFVTKIGPNDCDLENINREFEFQEEYYISSDKIDSVYIPERFFIKP
jgi:hypothetical protein